MLLIRLRRSEVPVIERTALWGAVFFGLSVEEDTHHFVLGSNRSSVSLRTWQSRSNKVIDKRFQVFRANRAVGVEGGIGGV